MESRHLVHAVVVRDGEVAQAWGDPDVVSFVRSAAKPLQALPLVPFELPDDEPAIACASHEALPEQLVAVRALLARAGAATEDLECGAEHGSKLRHNCSGKHAGFLFLARRRGWPSEGYHLPEHPLQQNVRELVAAAVGRTPRTSTRPSTAAACRPSRSPSSRWRVSSATSSAGGPRARTPSCGR